MLTGTLRRHAQTWQGISSGMQLAAANTPTVLVWPGLDEYDLAALIGQYTGKSSMPKTPEDMRNHSPAARGTARVDGETKPVRMPTYAEFKAGVISRSITCASNIQTATR